jgi:hypothetical protein
LVRHLKKKPALSLRVSPGISFPKLTCTRSRSEKKRKKGARKQQAKGKVKRTLGAFTGFPMSGNGLGLAIRAHSAITPQPPDLVKRFFGGRVMTFASRAAVRRRPFTIAGGGAPVRLPVILPDDDCADGAS